MFILRFRGATPASRVATLSPGRKTVIEGVVVAHQTMALGQGKLPCVWYDNLVESMKAGMRGTRALWFVERAECRFADFFVEDASGKIFVSGDPREVEVSGAKRLLGMMNKQGTERFVAHVIQPGMRVKIHRAVGESAGVPGGGPALRSTADVPLQILVRS